MQESVRAALTQSTLPQTAAAAVELHQTPALCFNTKHNTVQPGRIQCNQKARVLGSWAMHLI